MLVRLALCEQNSDVCAAMAFYCPLFLNKLLFKGYLFMYNILYIDFLL